jgi:hypothetical protein
MLVTPIFINRQQASFVQEKESIALSAGQESPWEMKAVKWWIAENA